MVKLTKNRSENSLAFVSTRARSGSRCNTRASTQTNAEKSIKSISCLFLIQDGRHHGNAVLRKNKLTPHARHHFYNLKIIYCVFTQNLRYDKE